MQSELLLKIYLCGQFLLLPFLISIIPLMALQGTKKFYTIPIFMITFVLSILCIRSIISIQKDIVPISNPDLACPRNMKSLDAVISWVNVTDPKWQKLAKKHYCSIDKYLTGAGDRDPFNALKYSIRSIRKNLKFIDKIIIVTERDQVPSWLQVNESFPGNRNIIDSKIQIIFHDEFMHPDFVPTFNSQPTEYSIYNLTYAHYTDKCFLYFNDDFLIMKSMEISDFIDQEGRIIFYGYNKHEFKKKIFGINFLDLPFGLIDHDIKKIIDPHVPYPINSYFLSNKIKECKNECRSIQRIKCRRTGSLWANFYYSHLVNEYSKGLVRLVSPWDGFFNRFALGLPKMNIRQNLFLLWLFQPKFVYIESHESVEENPSTVKAIQKFLDYYFPDPLPFENRNFN